jgi:hypothetical protein
MVLDFYEGHSDSCTESCTMSGAIPGHVVLEKKVPSGSSWSADVTVSNSGKATQQIDVYAYCQNAEGTGPEPTSCLGFANVEAGNQDGISLSAPPCPQRL